MTAGARWLPRATQLCIITLFTVRSEHWLTGAAMAALVVLSGLLPRGVELGRAAQVVLALLSAALVYPVQSALLPADAPGASPLGRFGTVVALGALFVLIPRGFLRWRPTAERGNAALSILALVGCSQGAHGLLYPGFLALFGLLQLAALRAVDRGRPPLGALTPRHRLVSASLLASTCLVGLALAMVLPPAQDWAMRTFYASFLKGRTGFTTDVSLGSLDEMYTSDAMVLRVYGPKPEHLRGAVFTTYRAGRWLVGRGAASRQVKLGPAGKGDDPAGRTRVVTVGGDPRRYFVPMRAADMRTRLGVAQVNSRGIFTTPPGEEASEVSFLPARRQQHVPGKPSADDLQVPPRIAAELRRIVGAWITPGMTPAQRLVTIESRLQRGYRYSLEFERPRGPDPVIDFLTRGKQGHCEYFAAALALLARAAGVPARVVTGYRVRELNALGGYHVVRERNAHSWVEGWVRGKGWQTYDATPPADIAASGRQETPTLGALADLAASWVRAAWDWVTSLTIVHMAAAVAGLLLIWGSLRLVRWLRQGKARAAVIRPLAYRDPVPALVVLLDALGNRGMPRRPTEPLERYARRLDGEHAGDQGAGRAAALLRRYAAWRYGAVGDAAGLAKEMRDAADSGGKL